MGPMDRVSIISLEMLEEVFTPQQYKRMLDHYIQGPMDRVSIISLEMLEEVFTPQQYKRMLDHYIQGPMDRVSIIELRECWRMFSHHNNIKGCWILYPRSDGSSVHPTTTISKHVGSLIQRIV